MSGEGKIGFINHVWLAFVNTPHNKNGDAIEYDKNALEKGGEILSWHVSRLPYKISAAVHHPIVLTVAFTVLAMIGVQFAFYPAISALFVKTAVDSLVSQVPLWTVKLAAYLLTQSAILGYGARAAGRFANSDLMGKYAEAVRA